MKSPTSRVCAECYDTPDEIQRRKSRSLKHWYGLSLDAYNALLEAQNHTCALCREPFGPDAKRSPAVDHNHKTGAIRGIVHQDCNRGLGHFDDDPDKIERAAEYLRTARTPYTASGGKYTSSLKKQRHYQKRTRGRSVLKSPADSIAE